VLQASREPWNTGLLHKSIDEPVNHEDVGHAAGDDVEKDLVLYVE